jgi:hypothetical protein
MMARMLGRILVAIPVLAAAAFALLVLIGLWDRYEKETAVLGFGGIYERLAWEVGLPSNPNARGVAAERASDGPTAREQLTPARSYQHVPQLVGTGARRAAYQGTSVALSADGKTAIVGGPGPNNADRDRSPPVGPAGAAWVFTRGGSVWTQQGSKLIGTTSEHGGGLWSQGACVALSADGDTAIVGGPSDNNTIGAAWVFSRDGGVWAQQGKKLVGTGGPGPGEPSLSLGQGMSVALSADGNTAIVGAWRAEGAFVFTRSGDVWTQQGKKLVGSSAVGTARQGMSVALSADGNTAIVGGWSDANMTGAAWVFARNGDVWKQQGKKLVGSGAVGSARQGTSVALSADGNTAILGGPGDNPSDRFGAGAAGAAWVFTRRGGVWTQQGHKLAATGGVWTQQGASVALAVDGNIALVGGFAHDRNAGAAAVFTRSGGEWTQEKEFAGHSGLGKAAPSVAVSADGSVVLLGEPEDNGGLGAALVFTRPGGGDY